MYLHYVHVPWHNAFYMHSSVFVTILCMLPAVTLALHALINCLPTRVLGWLSGVSVVWYALPPWLLDCCLADLCMTPQIWHAEQVAALPGAGGIIGVELGQSLRLRKELQGSILLSTALSCCCCFRHVLGALTLTILIPVVAPTHQTAAWVFGNFESADVDSQGAPSAA